MKIKKILSVLTSMIIITSMTVGCSNQNKKNNVIDLGYEVKSIEGETHKLKTNKFSFGEEILKINNNDIPYKVEGIISVPEGLKEKAPVVFIIHGQHSDKSNTEFEDGFKYLTEVLSKHGIIGISIDASMNYTREFGETPENDRISKIMQSHISSLENANKGTEDRYEIDLKDKVDLNKIGLIGHSVGGSGVFKVANDQIEKGFNNIKGIISLVPAYNSPIDKFPDVETSIIVSEYDGDVIHAGADLYEDIRMIDKNRENPVGLTYLIGGNHNSFNSVLGEKEFSTPQDTNGTYPEELRREEQRDFLENYAVDYMKSVFEFENATSPIFNDKETLPNKMYGYSTINDIYYSNSKTLFDKNQFKDTTFDNIKIREVLESSIPEQDTAKLFSVIEFTKGIELLQVDWDKNIGSLNIPLNSKDLSGFKELGIEWAINSPSGLNTKEECIKFDLILEDSKGGKSILKISGDNLSSMKYIYGVPLKSEYLEGEYMEFWSRKTPISTLTIPLDKMSNMDLSDISSIKLDFSSSEKGSILIKEIVGIKK